MLLHFERKLGRVAVDFEFDLERVVDAGELPGIGEVHVDDGTDYLDDITSIHAWIFNLEISIFDIKEARRSGSTRVTAIENHWTKFENSATAKRAGSQPNEVATADKGKGGTSWWAGSCFARAQFRQQVDMIGNTHRLR